MTKFEMLRSLPPSETAREPVRTVAELQRRIEELQPQKQIAEALEQLRSGLQSAQRQYLTELQRQTSEMLLQLRSGLESARSTHLDEMASKLEPMAQALASLTAETRSTLSQLQSEAAKHQTATAERWSGALSSWNSMVKEAEEHRTRLESATERAETAVRSLQWWTAKAWAVSALVGALAAALTVASWNYLRPPGPQSQSPILIQSLDDQSPSSQRQSSPARPSSKPKDRGSKKPPTPQPADDSSGS